MNESTVLESALFLNGVFQDVLEEILAAQTKQTDLVCLLQPYKSHKIKLLESKQPSLNKPITLYISTTTLLDKVWYTADIVGWEDKRELSPDRLEDLNEHIKRFQPGESEVYFAQANGNLCINLISISNLRKLPNYLLVTNLTKLSDGRPLKIRTQAGGWVPVYKLPQWLNEQHSVIKEVLELELERDVERSAESSDSARQARLENAPKLPQQVQVISKAFRRNPDVIVEVRKRANGKCERCGSDAPFLSAKDLRPFLEVHHLVQLSQEGEDTVENAVALCPNCHRELHYGLREDSV